LFPTLIFCFLPQIFDLLTVCLPKEELPKRFFVTFVEESGDLTKTVLNVLCIEEL